MEHPQWTKARLRLRTSQIMIPRCRMGKMIGSVEIVNNPITWFEPAALKNNLDNMSSVEISAKK